MKKELRITGEQCKSIEAVLREAESGLAGAPISFEYTTKGLDAKLRPILDEKQAARLEQLWFPRNGATVLRLSERAERFALTEEQAKQAHVIAQACDKERMDLTRSPGRSTMKRSQGALAAANEKVTALLDESQRAAWTLALGEPFKFKQ